MRVSPWPVRIGDLLLRAARADDLDPLLVVRNDPAVTRFMLRDHVDAATFRREWLATPDSATDFSCVAELDGQLVLHAAFDGLGLRRVTAGCYADNLASVRVLEKAGMRREGHGVEDSWHAELGWVDGYEYALLDRGWSASPAALRH